MNHEPNTRYAVLHIDDQIYQVPQHVIQQYQDDSVCKHMLEEDPLTFYRMLIDNGTFDDYLQHAQVRPIPAKDKTLVDHILDWIPFVM